MVGLEVSTHLSSFINPLLMPSLPHRPKTIAMAPKAAPLTKMQVKRTLRVTTVQRVLPGVPSGVEGYPMREWSVRIEALHPMTKLPIPATFLSKATYTLHPTFANPTQVFEDPPFQVTEQGWGEFDYTIDAQVLDGKKERLKCDLSFAADTYSVDHEIVIRNPKPRLLEVLNQEGGAGENGIVVNGDHGKVAVESARKKRKNERAVDMEKLADALQRLQEDDLLLVVEMVHNNRAPESFIKNDVEQGEFHVDLYTLPDNLINLLWKFCEERGVANH